MPWKSSRFWRNTVVLTRRSRPVPDSARIAPRFAKIRSVCSSMPPSMAVSPGFSPSWPETKTKPFAAIACEYGAPWNGAGALSVRTTVLSLTDVSSDGFACLGQCGAECLEDRFEHVRAVGAVEEPDVEDEPRMVGERFEEAADDVRAEPADTGVAQVDIRDDERLRVPLDDDVSERFRRRERLRAVPSRALVVQELGEGVAEGRAGRVDLRLGVAGLDVEDEVESRDLGHLLEEAVEDRQAGLDVPDPAAVDVQPDAGGRLLGIHASTRSICAPSARNRS